MNMMRRMKESNKLSEEWMNRLNEIGFNWEIRAKIDWKEMYRKLQEFREVVSIVSGFSL
jgi:hypothetical protein